MNEGAAVRRFQHRRVAEWPPEGGFSSVCDAVSLDQHTDLQERSIALLKAINWEGVAMVEYRFNPVTGKAVLMEINGRYWGSYPLAVECGVGFALISYYLHSGLGMPPLSSLRTGVRSRMVATEIKRLVRILFRQHLIVDRSFKIRRFAELARFISDFFRPRVTYYVWSVADPSPFFADIRSLVRKISFRS
jgi:predicted ATP-grasp superfamily ATP-dependent carboligase